MTVQSNIHDMSRSSHATSNRIYPRGCVETENRNRKEVIQSVRGATAPPPLVGLSIQPQPQPPNPQTQPPCAVVAVPIVPLPPTPNTTY
ncbi:hypothetical protein H6P81_021027 [Aristolochia fimbriata]|uniref:Uncharacterized protein n=1 Tax=Aristolochia fimbriata TaxID=158543 RepID=A0AAV7E0G4_ARIFI|nr:hypothetical protein H6P81_021027 [Aristolochia fimbriata]